MTLLQQFIDIVSCRTDITQGELYFILASVWMYFKSPLKTESWNTFKSRLESGELNPHQVIFMTDEEKNPHVWSRLTKKTRQELQEHLAQCLLATRKYLLKAYPELKPNRSDVDIVCIPDITDPSNLPTFFPKQYLKTQLKKKVFVNELTGQPLSWTLVDMVNKNKLTDCTKLSSKCVNSEIFLKLMNRDLQKLYKLATCCYMCKNKSTSFKSIKDYQTLYFCSLKCLQRWDVD